MEGCRSVPFGRHCGDQSATPAPQAVTATMEATENANFQNYTNRVNFDLMDHTDGGSTYTYAQKLTGGSGSQVGLAKSYKIYPGDKVKIEAYAKYYNPQSTTSNLAGFATSLLNAFGVPAPGVGEIGSASVGLDYYGDIVAGGGGGGNSSFPKVFVNILIFDKDYNLLDIAYEQINGGEQPVGDPTKLPHDFMSREYTAKEEGYAFVYVSNENPTLVEAYFDDVTFTYTPSNILQYNEYYPFGLNTANSWTRENVTDNSYLYNAGSERNEITGNYEMFFRNYDPALGRMNGVDVMASKYAGVSPFNYGFNNPVFWNDPTGADPDEDEDKDGKKQEKQDAHPGMYGDSFAMADAMFDMMNGVFNPLANNLTYGSFGGVGGQTSFNGFGAGYVPGSYGAVYFTTPLGDVVSAAQVLSVVNPNQNPLWRKLALDAIQKAIDRDQKRQQTQGGDLSVSQSNNDPNWFKTGVAIMGIVQMSADIASHNSKPRYMGPKAWAAEKALAKNFSKKLGVAGMGVTVLDAALQGKWENHHTADLIIGGVTTFLLVSNPVTATLTGAYFLVDLGFQVTTGKGITEHLFD